MVNNQEVPMWQIQRLLDLLYSKGVRHFLAFHRKNTVSIAERNNGNIQVLAAYPESEWIAVQDNLELYAYGTVYTPMAGGKIVLYALPVRGLELSDEIKGAMGL